MHDLKAAQRILTLLPTASTIIFIFIWFAAYCWEVEFSWQDSQPLPSRRRASPQSCPDFLQNDPSLTLPQSTQPLSVNPTHQTSLANPLCLPAEFLQDSCSNPNASVCRADLQNAVREFTTVLTIYIFEGFRSQEGLFSMRTTLQQLTIHIFGVSLTSECAQNVHNHPVHITDFRVQSRAHFWVV